MINKDSSRAAFEFFLRQLDTKRGGGVLEDHSVRQYLFDVASISEGLNAEKAIDYDLYCVTDPGIIHDLREDLLAMKFKLSEVNLIRHHSFSAALTHFERYLRAGAINVQAQAAKAGFAPMQFDKERAKYAVKGLAEDFAKGARETEGLEVDAPNEKELLELYRKLTTDNKRFAFKVISALSK